MNFFRRRKKLIFFSLFLALFIPGSYFAYHFLFPDRWYAFPLTESKDPQTKVIVPRDFAFRIGDKIPVSIIVKQQADTWLDISDLTVKGNFEIAKQSQLERKEFEDGSVCYKLDLVLQSFEAQAELSATASLSWSSNDGSASKELPIVIGPLHRSNTWDGRDKLQEGDLEATSHVWHLSKSIGALVASTLILVYLLIKTKQLYQLIWAYRHPLEAKLLVLNKLWAPIEAGDTAAENYAEIDKMIRVLFRIESAMPSEIRVKTDKPACLVELIKFVELGQIAIYSERTLSQEENASLKALSVQLCNSAFEPLSAVNN